MFYEDKGSSKGYVGDMVSPKGPLSCCSDVFESGKARKYFNDVMSVSYTHLDVYKRQPHNYPTKTWLERVLIIGIPPGVSKAQAISSLGNVYL